MSQISQPFVTCGLLASGLFASWNVANAQDTVPWAQGPFSVYEVPAMSSVPRMPDQIPTDGRLSTELRIVAARGEFEPASFVVVPRANVAKLELAATDLASDIGTIPASAVDLKVIKVWYQGGTAWYSYFGDSNRRQLIPELLLNDENLVRVDTQKKENYLRVGQDYQWISYPRSKAEKHFNYLTEPVKDAKTLQPVQLAPGQNKQIWVTVKVPNAAGPGLYRGKINLTADGQPAGAMDLTLRVLPFELPQPKTYYDTQKDYLVSIYSTGVLGIAKSMGLPREEAERLQQDIYKNLLDHNVYNSQANLDVVFGPKQAESVVDMRRELRLMKQSGFTLKPLITRGWVYYSGSEDKNLELYKTRVDTMIAAIKEELGHDDIYMATWDEAGVDRVKIMRQLAEYTATKGVKMWATTHAGRHFDLAGYAIDYANHGGWPKREFAATWHSVGSKVASYAGPHTGPENPNVFRLWEGLGRYKANYDGSFNYKYFSAFNPSVYVRNKDNLWNDFTEGAFRGFNMVYPTVNGPIDTLAWEGFREGIDDVRYATKLKTEADRAIATGRAVPMHTAKKALIWLELLDETKADLNSVRMEMIEHILKIQRATEQS